MENITYQINGKEHSVSIKESPVFQYGKDEVLSSKETDITYNQDWYDEGFTEVDFLNDEEFKSLQDGLSTSISKIIAKELEIDTREFSLEGYHNFVKSNEDHFKIVSKTRDLFATDFNFPITKLYKRLSELVGFELTDINSHTNDKVHIIVRINRPGSNDFNPPHKDIYEGVDKKSIIFKFLNFWIPIAGVTNKSALPLAPESHRLNENEIVRTFDGGTMQGNKYRVRTIKSWARESKLMRSTVKYGQVLMFSGHLIHGLAVNEEIDKTRVALEFRLFKKEK